MRSESLLSATVLVSASLGVTGVPARRSQPQFPRETYLDLLHVQVKTLSLLFYVQRYFPETLVRHGEQLCAGILHLFEHLLPEACNLRRDLLTTTRHFIQSETKNSAPLQATQKSCTRRHSLLLLQRSSSSICIPISLRHADLEPLVDALFDENLLLSSGWTCRDVVRCALRSPRALRVRSSRPKAIARRRRCAGRRR